MNYKDMVVLAGGCLLLVPVCLAMYLAGSGNTEGEDTVLQGHAITILCLADLVCNIAVTCMLCLYYQRSVDDILLTIASLAFLWPCALIDGTRHLIPNRILLFALAIRIAWFAVEALTYKGAVANLLLSSVIAGGALLLASALCKVLIPGSIGMGDVKILGVLGLYLGMDKIWGAVFMGLVSLFAVCLYLLVTRRAGRRSEIAFAPFMLAGTILGAILTGI